MSHSTADYAVFYINRLLDLAANHLKVSRHNVAKDCCEKVLAMQPDNLEAKYLLARVAAQEKDYKTAASLVAPLVMVQSASGKLLDDFYQFHKKAGQLPLALEHLKALSAKNPDIYGVWFCLAKIYTDNNNLDAFLQAAGRAKELAGGKHERYFELANIYITANQLVAAESCLRTALKQAPEHPDYCNVMGGLLKKAGRSDEAVEYYTTAVATIDLHQPEARLTNFLMNCISTSRMTPEQTFAQHQYWGERLCQAVNRFQFDRTAYSSDKVLNIGYVSADFCKHPVAFFLEPLLRVASNPAFRVFLYYNREKEDYLTEQIKERGHGWRNIHDKTDDEVCELIQNDKIDILADLNGWTAHNRQKVFAAKPAPVQISWLGYAHSTGLPTIDYRFSDAIADPPGTTEHLHTEKLYRLQDCFTAYNPVTTAPDPLPLPCTENGYITFVAYNNLTKTNDQLLEWWAEILKQVPDSRLMLKSDAFGKDVCFKEEWLARFARLGITAEQVVLNGTQVEINNHFTTLGNGDIFLDSYPYNGTTTTCETLWMAVPVITLAGRSHIARVSASILTSIGAPELIASSPQEYISKAVELAKDRQRLQYYRDNLRQMMQKSSLLDLRGLTRKLEAAYRDIWYKWCNGTG